MEFREADLRKVIADVFGIDPNTVDDDTSIDTVQRWDSLQHLNLVLALEERFNVSLTEEETVQILSYSLIKMTLEKYEITFAS